MTKQTLPHLKTYPGQIAPRVLTCGDPWRAQSIAEKMENTTVVSKNREYWVFNGEYNGVPVTVASHGVGASGAAICFEELIRSGAKVIIRVGTCGALQPEVVAGDLVVATGGVREDGVTPQLVPLSYPAVADSQVADALYAVAKEKGARVHKGLVLSLAAFYPGLMPLANRIMAKAGVLASENEVATLLVIASLHGVKASAIIAVDGKAFELEDDWKPHHPLVKETVEKEIDIALEAVTRVKLEE